MNDRQRKTLANKIAAIAKAHGATVEVTKDFGGIQRTFPGYHVAADFPHVKVSIDVDNLHRGGVMAHWHSATRPIAMATPLGEPNACHRRKATLYRDTGDAFLEAFERAAEAISSGAAYDDAWKPAQMRG